MYAGGRNIYVFKNCNKVLPGMIKSKKHKKRDCEQNYPLIQFRCQTSRLAVCIEQGKRLRLQIAVSG
jgi:hypothetical protein